MSDPDVKILDIIVRDMVCAFYHVAAVKVGDEERERPYERLTTAAISIDSAFTACLRLSDELKQEREEMLRDIKHISDSEQRIMGMMRSEMNIHRRLNVQPTV